MDEKNWKQGAGGTKGGFGTFFVGLVLTLIGGYLFTNQVTVTSGFFGWRFGFFGLFGGASASAFGVTMILFCLGVAFLFFDYESWIGRGLTGAALLLIIVGIIASLRVIFRPTPLYVVLVILAMLFGGIGLIFRSFRVLD